MTAPVVMLVAAEASGDALGAGLMKALKARLGEIRFVGVGGPAMASQGLSSAFDISELSIMGLVEGLAAYPKVRARVGDLVSLAQRHPPDVAVLIDSFGFTSRVGKALKLARPGLPLIKYVGPQVWASRPGRAKDLAATFDHLLAILPFDAPFYEPFGLPVTFVGNPALALDLSGSDAGRCRSAIGAGPDDPILLVLPGSRPGEIARMAAPFEEAVRRLKDERPGLHIILPVADTVAQQVRSLVAGWPYRVHLVEGEGPKRDAMTAATVALACSGTVTSELALAGAPMVIGYRLSPLTWLLLKPMIRVKYASLINIAADREVAPERLQGDCTGEKLAREVARLLDDPAARRRQATDQFEALERLGYGMPDPAAKAAEVVAGYLKR